MCFETTLWLDRLWSEHVEASEGAQGLIKAGVDKQGEEFAGFPADLHARLYLPQDPSRVDRAPGWAVRLHELASELSEWQRLRAMCARNGFAAGIAAESMLAELLPHVPERHEAAGGQSSDEQGEDQARPAEEAAGAAGQPDGEGDFSLRAAIRKATRSARSAVHEAESAVEGIAGPLGFEMPGTRIVNHAGPADLKAIREAHSQLEARPRLKRICELAGRMQRAAASKARSRVKPGVGEVHGIAIGGLAELARILPGEIGQLRLRKLRTLVFSKLLQRKALAYDMAGREPLTCGPVVVLLDESSSMRKEGRDVWSKAVAMAVLGTATRQARGWHLVGFNGTVTRQVAIQPGAGMLADVVAALDHGCAGGTDFDRPIRRAIAVIHGSSTMAQADVVMITDGEASLEQGTIEQAKELTRSEGVSWFIIGIGAQAGSRCARSLEPIATDLNHVARLDDSSEIIDVINLGGKERR